MSPPTSQVQVVDTDPGQYRVAQQPYYRAVSDEVEIYQAAYQVRMPVMLKGPTGCGKTRFVEYMAWLLKKPLITVACTEDMTASDLVGRYLLDINGSRWQDGPLTVAARIGAICYLDEIVEARQDTIVVIHPLTDHRRELPLEKKGELVRAHEDFQVVISYNPGYQSLMKSLKQSTRLLIYAAQLIAQGVEAPAACRMALVTPLCDDPDLRDTLFAAVDTYF